MAFKRLENRFQKANREALEALSMIVEATLNDSFVYVTPEISEILSKKGLTESSIDFKDADGNIATRATQLGIDTIPTSLIKKGVRRMFEIENIAVAEKSARIGKASIYPFSQLEVGQSFFVPATTEMPEPWITLGSCVSNATKKYAILVFDEHNAPVMRQNKKGRVVQCTKDVRKFCIQQDTRDNVLGARIGRRF